MRTTHRRRLLRHAGRRSCRPKMCVKADHNRALHNKIGRSRGSIEFKHQNISAVLPSLGEDWIPGYKPAFNFQMSLVDAIRRWFAMHPDRLKRPPSRPRAGFSNSHVRCFALMRSRRLCEVFLVAVTASVPATAQAFFVDNPDRTGVRSGTGFCRPDWLSPRLMRPLSTDATACHQAPDRQRRPVRHR